MTLGRYTMARLCIPLEDDLDDFSAETMTRRLLNDLVEDASDSDEFFDQWESRSNLAKQFVQELDDSFSDQ